MLRLVLRLVRQNHHMKESVVVVSMDHLMEATATVVVTMQPYDQSLDLVPTMITIALPLVLVASIIVSIIINNILSTLLLNCDHKEQIFNHIRTDIVHAHAHAHAHAISIAAIDVKIYQGSEQSTNAAEPRV